MGKSVSTWWEWKKKEWNSYCSYAWQAPSPTNARKWAHGSTVSKKLVTYFDWLLSLLRCLTQSSPINEDLQTTCSSCGGYLRAALSAFDKILSRFNLLVAVGVAIVQSSLTELHASSFHRLSEKCSKVWVICIDILHPVCRASHMSPVSRSLYQTRGKEKTN